MTSERRKATEPSRSARPSPTKRRPEPIAASDAEVDFITSEVNDLIAGQLRAGRKRLGLTLQQVADRSGLSVGMVSKVENAQTSPSLATLTRLAKALAVPLTSFFRGFEEERDVSYVKAGKGIEIQRTGVRHGHHYELIAAAQGVGRIVRPFLVTLTERAGPYPMSQHIGVEFLYQLDGAMEYRYGAQTFRMEPGDSLLFDGRVPHRVDDFHQLPARYLSIFLEVDTDGVPTAAAPAADRPGHRHPRVSSTIPEVDG